MMYQLEKLVVDDEIMHEKKHQQNKLDHTENKEKKFNIHYYYSLLLCYLIVKLTDSDC